MHTGVRLGFVHDMCEVLYVFFFRDYDYDDEENMFFKIKTNSQQFFLEEEEYAIKVLIIERDLCLINIMVLEVLRRVKS